MTKQNAQLGKKNVIYSFFTTASKSKSIKKGEAMSDEQQFEQICAEVHNGWWEQSKKAGRRVPNDRMYPYEKLSEKVK